MPLDFCTRTAGKLRRMGLGRRAARFFAGFFYVSMVSVCALMGAAPCPEGRGGTGGEIRKTSRRPVLLPSVLLYPDVSPGIVAPGPRAVYIAPGYSRIRRR